ncbi:uncharacterized protein [Montipora capricornis]|uniref:uncharacterized protein n=1 Tax=Montipora capricornis TaxID=246305 RepID=UPI0035F13D36
MLKPKEACDETAEVSNSYRKEAAKITDSKQPSEMADIKHELKNVIFNRRLAKGLDHLEIPTTPANKPTVEKVEAIQIEIMSYGPVEAGECPRKALITGSVPILGELPGV